MDNTTSSDTGGLGGDQTSEAFVIGAIVVVSVLFLFLVTCVIIKIVRRNVIKRPEADNIELQESENVGPAKVHIDARMTPQLYKMVGSRLRDDNMRKEYMDAFKSKKKKGSSSRASSTTSSVVNGHVSHNGSQIDLNVSGSGHDNTAFATPAHADVGL